MNHAGRPLRIPGLHPRAGAIRPATRSGSASADESPAGATCRQRAWNALITALLSYLLLTAALSLAAQLFPFLRDPIYADKAHRLGQRETATPNALRVVMLGTSRTGYAFDAGLAETRLAEALGRPVMAFNFGVPASGPVLHKLYLDRLLTDKHPMDLLVVEILPSSLAELPEGPYEQVFTSGERLSYGEMRQAIGYGFDESAVRQRWQAAVWHPWHALRFPLLGRLAASWLPWHLRHDCGRITDAHGWIVPKGASDTPDTKEAAFQRAWKEYHALLATMSPGGGAARAFQDLLARAQQASITLLPIIMPESPRFRQMYHPEVLQRLDSFLDNVTDRFGLGWVDARDWLPEEAFYDGHHMLRVGAEAFTSRLTQDLLLPRLLERLNHPR